MCLEIRIHVRLDVCIHVRVGMCIDVRVAMCIHVRVGMCIDVHLDMCIHMRVAMCIDVGVDMCADGPSTIDPVMDACHGSIEVRLARPVCTYTHAYVQIHASVCTHL